MRPYLFNYSETVELAAAQHVYNQVAQRNFSKTGEEINFSSIKGAASTLKTAAIEQIDEDRVFASTLLTKSIEPTDDDSISFMSTVITATPEHSDPDGISLVGDGDCQTLGPHALSTLSTESIENSDPDSIWIS